MAEIPEYVEKFTVHAYVPLTWKSVNLWAWSAPDGTNAFAAWPGQAMDEGEDGWFTAKAPTWVNSVIVNGNEGTVQTADISIEGKELWITVYEDLSSPTQIRTKRLKILPSALRFPPTGLLRAAGHGLRRTAQMHFLRGPVRL